MGTFNYSNIHIFRKDGKELPCNIKSSYKIEIPSKNGSPAVFYAVCNPDGTTISYHKESSGSRFDNSTSNIPCLVNGNPGTVEVTYNEYSAINPEEDYSSISEYSIDNIVSIDSSELDNIKFPSIQLSSYVNFNIVSTELIETESFYILVKNDDGEFVPIAECYETFGNRYELLFYIDTHKQEEFKFFNVSNEDVVWSNKTILNLLSSEEDGYRVNVGFSAKEEGTYKEDLHICILDRGEGKTISLEECDIFHIGTITLTAESIGEDERYRTLFTNFGIPDPKTYEKLFKNVETDEAKIDNIALNQNSKKLFLSYAEIFPYAGTYKALLNAIKILGYENIFFKEWYKRTGNIKNSSYVSYDMTYKSDINANIINNASMEERIHLKKLNWLSMIYKINEELKNIPEDEYGFPSVIDVSNEPDIIVKLISLRDWLQKYIIGLNCRIIDIGGEGIYFERYKLGYYSTYQEQFDYDNEHLISPYIIDNKDNNILIDCSTNILVNVGADNRYLTLESLSSKRFEDFCEGYFDSSNNYHIGTDEIDENEDNLYIGKTLYIFTDLERYKIRASVSCNDYSLSKYIENIDNDVFLDASSSNLIISNNRLILNPLDIHNNQNHSAKFSKLPIILFKKGAIFKETIHDGSTAIPWGEYEHEIYEYDDYISLYPKDFSEFSYEEDSVYSIPVFKIKSYNLSTIGLLDDDTYIIDLIDCKLVFNNISNEYDKSIVINFNTEENKKFITVNTIYYSNEFFIKKYKTSNNEYTNHFIDGRNYDYFVNSYKSEEDAIVYNDMFPLKVNTAGEFTVDIIGFDIHGNMFPAKCKNSAVVCTPKYETVSFANVKSLDSNEDTSTNEIEYIDNNYINYCIYEKEYNFPFSIDASSVDSSIREIEYNNVSNISNENNNYIHFSNKMEKVDVQRIINTNPSTVSRIYKDDDYYDMYTSYSMYVKRSHPEINPNYYFDTAQEDEVNKFIERYGSTKNDVNVVFYNELGGYPMYQTYGIICKDSSCGDGEYKINIVDDNIEEYLWVGGNSLVPQLISNDLAKSTILLMNDYDSSNYSYLEDFLTDYYLESVNKIFSDSSVSLNDIDVNQYLSDDVNDYTQEYINNFLSGNDSPTKDPSCYLNTIIENNIFNDIDFIKDISDDNEKIFKTIYIKYTYDEIFKTVKSIINDYINNNYANIKNLIVNIIKELENSGNSLFKDFIIEDNLIELLKDSIANYVIELSKNRNSKDGFDIENELKLSSFLNSFYSNLNVNYLDIPRNIDSLLYEYEQATNNLKDLIDETLNIDNYEYTYKLCVIFVYLYIGYYVFGNNDYIKTIIHIHMPSSQELNLLKDKSEIAIKNYFEYDISSISIDYDILGELNGKGAKGMLIPYKYHDATAQSKYGNRLFKYILSEKSNEISKNKNFITAEKFKNDENNNLFYYAVTYKRDNEIYYIKPSGASSWGYNKVSKEIIPNFTFNLEELSNSNNIGVYIEPIYKIQVVVNKKDPKDETGQTNLPQNQLAIYILNDEQILLNKNDMIKITFSSTTINEYFAQSSYKVVNIAPDSSWIIVEGDINNEYIRNIGNYVIYVPQHSSSASSWNVYKNNLDRIKDKPVGYEYDTGGCKYIVSRVSARVRQDDAVITKQYAAVHVYNINTSKKMFAAVLLDKDENVWGVILYAGDASSSYSVRLSGSGYYGIDMFISYAHCAYSDYVLEPEYIDNTNITISNNRHNKRYLDFIDSKFLLSTRKFNTDNGISSWMDMLYFEDVIKDSFGGTPKILDSSIYKYYRDLPVIPKELPNLTYCIKNENSIGLPNGFYAYWKIYKQSNVDNGKEYMFESYNPALYLDCNLSGIYDLILYVYDKFGNISVNEIPCAFKVF